MNLSNLHKKAQSLPLNTIVIAILVVIVLLIIIVTFTDSFTGSNDAISEASGCSETNPLVGLKYQNPYWSESANDDDDVRIAGVPKNSDDESCFASPKPSN